MLVKTKYLKISNAFNVTVQYAGFTPLPLLRSLGIPKVWEGVEYYGISAVGGGGRGLKYQLKYNRIAYKSTINSSRNTHFAPDFASKSAHASGSNISARNIGAKSGYSKPGG